MFDFVKDIDKKSVGLFVAGVVFGTAGIKILSSKDAKKVYTHTTAAALRAKEVVLDTVASIQENAEDIYADAKQINDERAAMTAEYDDAVAEKDKTEEEISVEDCLE